MHSKLSVVVLAAAGFAGCASNQTPDVAVRIRASLQQAGLKDITVSQDHARGVVRLTGSVKQDGEKARADQIAGSLAAGLVVADELAVLPAGDESLVRSINANLDKGIEGNLAAALLSNHFQGINHTTTNGVVTLKGNLPTQERRSEAERLAANVPNVQQVVNEIDVAVQRASSSGSADRSQK